MHRQISGKLLLGLGLCCLLAVVGWRLFRPSHGKVAGRLETIALPLAGSSAPISSRSVGGHDGKRQREPLSATELATAGLRAFALQIEAMEAEADPEKRDAALEQLVAETPEADIPAALAFLQARRGSKGNGVIVVQLVRRWAKMDPRAVAAWVADEYTGEARQRAIQAVAIVWAEVNTSDAAAWIREFPPGKERDGGLTALAYEMARIEPVKALAAALELPAGSTQEDLMQHASAQLAATDPDVAAWWANQLTDAPLRQRVLANIVSVWGDTDPAGAAELATEALERGKPLEDAMVGIVQRWVQKTPEEAAAWVTSFPAGALRETSLESVARLWADQDLPAAGRWLNRLDSGPGRDAAVVGYVTKISGAYPELARRWASTIENEALRIRQLESVGAQ